MKTLTLTRFASCNEMGTFGRMDVAGEALYTVERPWLDNKPSISCIPEGWYECKPDRYNAGGYDSVEVQNVVGRSEILFHIANVMDDVKGCIGPGLGLGFLKTKNSAVARWAVTSSTAAFKRFMEHYGQEPFVLRIENQF